MKPVRRSRFDCRFDASTLDKIFEWCEEHRGAGTTHKDFSLQVNFANEYDESARRQLTPWQADFFDRYAAHKWQLAAAASYLDVPYLYYAACLVISGSLRAHEWDKEVPESVPDDVLCDVLRFFSYEDIHARDPQQPRWKRFIEKNASALPLKIVTAHIIGEMIAISTSVNDREDFDDLESLRRYAVEKCYAFGDLSVHLVVAEDTAAVQAFLSQSSARLRAKCMSVDVLPRESREGFRTCVTSLMKLAERLNFLEEVQLCLSRNMQVECLVEEPGLLAFPSSVQELSVCVSVDVDTNSITEFVEPLRASWNRSLSINYIRSLSAPLSILTKVYEKFASDREIAPLRIRTIVPHSRQTRACLKQFAASEDSAE